MNVEELKQKMKVEEDFTVFDIREVEEVENSEMIPGAEHVPMGKVFTEAAKGNLSKDKKIVMVCRTGGRCEVVARELKDEGYDIEFLEGGMEAWKRTQES